MTNFGAASNQSSAWKLTPGSCSHRAIERGSHEELLARNGVYRKLWDDQGHLNHDADDDDDDADDEDDDEEDEGEEA